MGKGRNAAVNVVEILKESGPSLSSRIVERLITTGMNAVAARKRVSRSIGGIVQRVKGITFPHREAFLYLREIHDGQLLLTPLWEALNAEHSAVADAVHSLHLRGGIVPWGHFGTVSGSPGMLKGHLSSHRVLNFLRDYGLAKIQTVGELGECVVLADVFPFDINSSASRLKARLVAERIVIEFLSEWLRRMGLIAFGSVRLRDGKEQPEFGQYVWDVTAPSYVYPLAQRQTGKNAVPGFFVADVALGKTVTIEHAKYFLQKCATMRYQRRTRPFLAMIVADGFAGPAFDAIRREGVMAVSLANLTGEGPAAALRALINTLSNAAAVVAERPEAIGELFAKLGAIEGAASNLRGPLFELIVAHCVREREGTSVDIGRPIWDPKTNRGTDIDVLRVKEKQEVAAYECRGHGPNTEVDAGEVNAWLEVTVPKIRNYLLDQERFANSKLIFEFWTTGSFTESALARLAASKSKTKKYEIRWCDGNDVLKYARSIKASHLVNVLQEHYLRHPVTRLRGSSPETGSGNGQAVEPEPAAAS